MDDFYNFIDKKEFLVLMVQVLVEFVFGDSYGVNFKVMINGDYDVCIQQLLEKLKVYCVMVYLCWGEAMEVDV